MWRKSKHLAAFRAFDLAAVAFNNDPEAATAEFVVTNGTRKNMFHDRSSAPLAGFFKIFVFPKNHQGIGFRFWHTCLLFLLSL
jgi:hypothetical protein